mmetsp:Transcript_51064/g.141401  ORF Transcript_51064/g.141401 Transcript_51064/m.141401 type:complete len:502 (-) Transcript_51064:23-1528(-)
MAPAAAELRAELRIWWGLVWPSVITSFCRAGMDLTDLSVLGHYHGGSYLSDASYASIVLNSVMVIVARGMSGNVVRALCSTAFGAGNLSLMGAWLQVAVLCSTAVAALLSPIWFWGGNLLSVVVGRTYLEAGHIQEINLFCRISLLWMLPRIWNACLDSFLAAQNIVYPQMCVAMLGLLVNFGANFVLIYGFGFGYPGSPLATVWSRWFTLVALLTYLQWKQVVQASAWGGWDLRQSARPHRVKEYLKQALPSALGGMAEEYQFLTLGVFAGWVGPDAVATMTCFLTLIMVMCSVMWGLMGSTTVRMGHHLGSHNLPGMWHVIRVATFAAVSWGLLVTLLITAFHTQVGAMLSSKSEVQQLSDEIALLVGIGYFFLALFYVAMAMLTAAFKQGWIAVAFFLGCWGICVPLSWLLAFRTVPGLGAWYPGRLAWDTGPHHRGMGLLGLWVGLAVGYLVTTFLAVAGVCRIQWPEIIEEAARKSETRATLRASQELAESAEAVS